MFINILILLISLNKSIAYDLNKDNYVFYNNSFLNITDNLTVSFNNLTINKCILLCNKNNKCQSFNYYLNNTNNYICQYFLKKHNEKLLKYSNNSIYFIKYFKNSNSSGNIIIVCLFLTLLFVFSLFLHYQFFKKKRILTQKYDYF